MDSGLAAEPVIGPAEGRTRWRRPGMTPHLIRISKSLVWLGKLIKKSLITPPPSAQAKSRDRGAKPCPSPPGRDRLDVKPQSGFPQSESRGATHRAPPETAAPPARRARRRRGKCQ